MLHLVFKLCSTVGHKTIQLPAATRGLCSIDADEL